MASLVVFFVVALSLSHLPMSLHAHDSLEQQHGAIEERKYYSGWGKKQTVRVMNCLSKGEVITVHCKSADDDLGTKTLAYQQATEWSFKISWVATTRFTCDVRWRKKEINFVAYEEGPLLNRETNWNCENKCVWKIESEYILGPDEVEIDWN